MLKTLNDTQTWLGKPTWKAEDYPDHFIDVPGEEDCPLDCGIPLTVPDELAGNTDAENGLVNVCHPLFGADPQGEKDSTQAIQKAVNYARDHFMVCFFPSGRYRVSDTITCVQKLRRTPEGRILHGKNIPCYLLGSAASEKRAEIFLTENAPGFADKEKPKSILKHWPLSYNHYYGPIEGAPQYNIQMNQCVVNLDITVGEGNAGAIALELRGAQGTGAYDCTLDATHGYAGLKGGCGSGGCHAGITIIGGEIGMLNEGQPATTMAGMTFLDQRGPAFVYTGSQGGVAVGVCIRRSQPGPAFSVPAVELGKVPTTMFSLIDAEIEFTHHHRDNLLVDAGCSVYLRNVYTRNAATVIRSSSGLTVIGGPEWTNIRELAAPVNLPPVADPIARQHYHFKNAVTINGRRSEPLIDCISGNRPQEDLVRKHLWHPVEMPFPDSSGAINVKSAYGAVGDGVHDDTEALQNAINHEEILFLPKGYYRITRPLQLRAHSKLTGISCVHSVIMTGRQEPIFNDPEHPLPLVQSADSDTATTVLTQLGVVVPFALTGCYALSWRSGGDSVIRLSQIGNPLYAIEPVAWGPLHRQLSTPACLGWVKRSHPLVQISARGGGKWYAYYEDVVTGDPGPDYCHLLIDGTSSPVTFYHCNPEHAFFTKAHCVIRNCKKVIIFGLKGENQNEPVLSATNCEELEIHGYGGNAGAAPGKALLNFENVRTLTISSACDNMQGISHPPSHFLTSDDPNHFWKDPQTWFFVAVKRAKDERQLRSAALDRPLFYRIDVSN